MPDIPLPKPPKPSGLAKPPTSTPQTVNQKQSGGISSSQSSHQDLSQVLPSNPINLDKREVGSQPVSQPSATQKIPPPKKPPAVVTALHSVSPTGIPASSNQLEATQTNYGKTRGQKPTLSGNVKVAGRLSQPKPQAATTTNNLAPPPPPQAAPRNQTNNFSSTAKPQAKAPVSAKPKRSLLSKLPYLFGGVALLLVLAIVGFKLLNGRSSGGVGSTTPPPSNSANESVAQPGNSGQDGSNQPTANVELEYWGLWEPKEIMQPIIDEFQQQNPGISIRYIKQSPKDYRERLQTAIASGNGPDLFRYHASWVPMLADDLDPMPASVMSASEFQQTFYPVATKQLQASGQLVGLPLEYDGLMLFYNKDILQAANETPPKSWAQVRALASKLTLREEGKIKRAGIALGAADNVDNFSDILGLLMFQNGAKLTQPDSPEVRDALVFYTNFITSDNVWDNSLPNSTVAFARGEAAMLLAPSWRVHQIKDINPELKFAAVPVPQVTEENQVAWASFWAEGVNKQSKNKQAAWQFLKFLTSKETEQKLFAQAAKTRLFGEPYSRIDLANQLAGDPILSALATDAPYADSWYLNSDTFDNGINDQIIKYYKDAVNAILAGKEVQKVLPTLAQGVHQVLIQYNVTK